MTMNMGKANLEEFAETLLELAMADQSVLAVTSDSRGSGKLNTYATTVPDQIVEVGIAEQNLVGISAGLAATGRTVFAVSPACFLTARSLEQIKNDIAYSDRPVTVVGISAGVSYGALGSTHHSIHDIAVLRAINNIDIVTPADNFETREAVKASAVANRPIYLRFGKKLMHHIHKKNQKFEIGKAITIREGSDIAFIACGETVERSIMAANTLAKQGISSTVISVHTIKPLDEMAILKAASQVKAMVTVEEHSIFGGLGEAISSLLMQSGIGLPFKIVGIPDEYTITGNQIDIFNHYGISADGLVSVGAELLKLGSTE